MQPTENSDFRTSRGYELAKEDEIHLSPAMEDYLEMIGRLCREDGYTRIGVLSSALQVKPSSASKMVSKLKEQGYLDFDRHGGILLTAAGKTRSRYLLDRHHIIETFLQAIGSPAPLREAELIEHYLSPETVYAIRDLMEQLRQ